MSILVTGGAGYIGSHTCIELLNAGYDVVVVDNLYNSCEESLRRVQKITGKELKFYKADILDKEALTQIFEKESIDSVIHLSLIHIFSNTYIFWRIRMPACRQGILAGIVLAFARSLGEYGATSMVAGYTPGRTATISTTVYQLWRTNDDALAFRWVMVNLAISAVVLLAVNLLERKER